MMNGIVKHVAIAVLLLAVAGLAACGREEPTQPSGIALGTYTTPSAALAGEDARRMLEFLADGALGKPGIVAHSQWLPIAEMNEALADATDKDLPAEWREPIPLEIRVRLRLVLGSEWYSLHRELEFPAVEFSSSATHLGVWHAEAGVLVLDRSGSTPLRCSVAGNSIGVPYVGREFPLTWASDSTEEATPTFVGGDGR